MSQHSPCYSISSGDESWMRSLKGRKVTRFLFFRPDLTARLQNRAKSNYTYGKHLNPSYLEIQDRITKHTPPNAVYCGSNRNPSTAPPASHFHRPGTLSYVSLHFFPRNLTFNKHRPQNHRVFLKLLNYSFDSLIWASLTHRSPSPVTIAKLGSPPKGEWHKTVNWISGIASTSAGITGIVERWVTLLISRDGKLNVKSNSTGHRGPLLSDIPVVVISETSKNGKKKIVFVSWYFTIDECVLQLVLYFRGKVIANWLIN